MLTVVTAVWAAVLAGHDVAGLIRAAAPVRTFHIRVVRNPAALPAGARGAQAWIREIRVDGVVAPPGSIETEGDWKVRDSPGHSGPRFVHEGGGPAALSVAARSIEIDALHHPWSGALDVEADEEKLGRVVLFSPASRFERVELPARPFPWLPSGLALAAFLLLAFRFAPWRRGRTGLLWLVVFLAAVHLHDWAAHAVRLTSDSPGYLEAIETFVSAGHPTYFPIGYGAFLEVCRLLPGLADGHAITLVQHLLAVFSVVLLYDLGRRVAPEGWVFAAALLAGVLAPIFLAAQAVMPESFTMFCLAAAAWCVLTRREGRASWRALGAGAALAAATLARVVPVAVLAPLVVAGALTPWRDRSWRFLVLGLGTGLLVVAGTLVHDAVRSGNARLSTGAGRHLYNHFVVAQGLLDPEAEYTSKLQAALGKDARLTEMKHWDVSWALTDRQRAELPADIHLQVALEAARTASVPEHLWFDAVLCARHLFANPLSAMGPDPTAFDDRGLAAGPLLSAWTAGPDLRRWTAAVHGPVWQVLAALSLLAVFLGGGRGLGVRATLLWIPLAYLFGSSAVEYYLPRYNAAVAPFVAIGAFVGLGLLDARRRR